MPRNATYDYARLLAAFGIVLFHADGPGAQVGYAALPFFLMLMISLSLPAAQTQSFGRYARTRAQRLLVPWLLWSGIYGILKLAEVLATSATWGDEFRLHMLLTGPALHLWFLPAAFVACLAIQPVVRRQPAFDGADQTAPTDQTTLAIAVALSFAALALLGLRQDQALPVPLAQWAYVAPAACLGLALALHRAQPLMALALTVGFIGGAWALGWHQGLPQIALAALMLILCGVIRLPATRLSALAAQFSLGIYLAHPLVFSLLERSTSLSHTTLAYAAVATLGAMVVAAAVDWALQRPDPALSR